MDQTKILVLDVETTTKNKGNPFTLGNKLVSLHTKQADQPTQAHFNLTKETDELINSASLVVGFNLKFDLHWIKKTRGILPNCIWDCQLAEFLFSKQTLKYPALNDAAIKYNLPLKKDRVKELWDQGFDTDEIDPLILKEYGNYDVDLTYEVFLNQVETFKKYPQLFRLFRLHCNDLLVLQEIEENGILYDCEASLKYSEEIFKKVELIDQQLNEVFNNVPINYASTDHKSAILYGGRIIHEYRLPIGVFKSGAKAGQTRYRIHEQVFEFPRLVEPIKGSELTKPGYWSTDEPTLRSLKTNKQSQFIIDKLLERIGLLKLTSTYLKGIPELIEKMEWIESKIHSNFNQCVAVSGRLSSTKPNVQNQPYEVKQFCVSRF